MKKNKGKLVVNLDFHYVISNIFFLLLSRYRYGEETWWIIILETSLNTTLQLCADHFDIRSLIFRFHFKYFFDFFVLFWFRRFINSLLTFEHHIGFHYKIDRYFRIHSNSDSNSKHLSYYNEINKKIEVIHQFHLTINAKLQSLLNWLIYFYWRLSHLFQFLSVYNEIVAGSIHPNQSINVQFNQFRFCCRLHLFSSKSFHFIPILLLLLYFSSFVYCNYYFVCIEKWMIGSTIVSSVFGNQILMLLISHLFIFHFSFSIHRSAL